MRIGIIGGTGELGRSIARAWLDAGIVSAGDLRVSGRSKDGRWPGPESVAYGLDNAALADWADVIVLSVPPALAASVGIKATGKLVISVMAGVEVETIARLTGADRVVRAMSSPAAALRLAFSPWHAGPGATSGDRALAERLFAATGRTAEVSEETHLDVFTAMTGPVPGFVALFAASMAAHARSQGIAPDVADLAVRQLFLAAGHTMQNGLDPEAQVQAMIDYAGTTAAGIEAMRAAGLDRSIAVGLDAAAKKAQEFGRVAGLMA